MQRGMPMRLSTGLALDIANDNYVCMYVFIYHTYSLSSTLKVQRTLMVQRLHTFDKLVICIFILVHMYMGIHMYVYAGCHLAIYAAAQVFLFNSILYACHLVSQATLT